MPRFRLYSSLTGAKMIIERDGKEEVIDIERPFWEDVLLAKWINERYKIVRSGLLLRSAKIFLKGELIGRIKEVFGFTTSISVFSKSDKVFDIVERDYLLKQEFIVKKGDRVVGVIRPIGVYVPLLSNIGKGFSGEFYGLSPSEEKLLVLSIIALGV